MATTPIPSHPTVSSSGRPNQKALDALVNRYLYFMAKRDAELRAKKAKGRNRAASIKI